MPKKAFPEEEQLLLELRRGNQQAFSELYKRNRAWIYASIVKLVKSHEFATELLQDVFMKVWQHRERIDMDKHFRWYLLKIARNTVYDFFRKAAHQQHIREQLISASIGSKSYNPIEDQLYFKEAQDKLEKALDKLPEKCRQVFVLCKIEGKSYNEVADILNISTATINNHIVKATRILREHWSLTSAITPALFFLLISNFNKLFILMNHIQ
jgi:RNA polymerase sigma-70 factor (family 1)